MVLSVFSIYERKGPNEPETPTRTRRKRGFRTSPINTTALRDKDPKIARFQDLGFLRRV
jgi:hypothetical protein